MPDPDTSIQEFNEIKLLGTTKVQALEDVSLLAVEGIGVLSNTIAPKVKPNLNYRFRAPPPGTPDLSR